jgi:hypothetical protein
MQQGTCVGGVAFKGMQPRGSSVEDSETFLNYREETVMAGGKKDQEGTSRILSTDHLNNIVKMDPQGHRTAKCLCEVEFGVTTTTPVVQRGDETYYLHSEDCKDMFIHTAPQEQERIVTQFWARHFPFEKLPTNAHEEHGHKEATCLCGTNVTVTKDTPMVTENGLNIYLCSEACSTMLHGMSAEDRMQGELKNIRNFQPAYYARSA